MDKKPLIYFFSLLIIAALVIVWAQYKSDPFTKVEIHTHNQQQKPAFNAKPNDPAIELFTNNCARCHGGFGEGKGTNPSLQNNGLGVDEIIHIITNGRGSMPSFIRFSQAELQKLAELVQRF